MSTDTLTQALEYARVHQWYILPVDPVRKKPIIEGWQEEATTDPDKIAGWWRQWPDARIGVLTGPKSQLCVIDCDSIEALERLEREGTVPPTLTSRTGRGKHLLYSTVADFKGRQGLFEKGSKIDVKCQDGFVIVPPSVHHDDVLYTWENWGHPIAPLPEWMAEEIQFGAKPKKSKAKAPVQAQALPPGYAEKVQQSKLLMLRTAPDGGKHSALLNASMRIAGMVATGWSDQATETALMLKALGENATKPTDLENAKRTIASAFLKATPEDVLNLAHTEYDLGLRFAKDTSDLRYLDDEKRWLRFKGGVWKDCPVPCLAVGKMVQAIMKEPPAPDVEPSNHEKSLKRFLSARSMGAIANLAGLCPEILIHKRELDQDPYLFNTRNGTVDLRTGVLHPHDPAQLLTMASPYPYDPKAKHPLWSKALDLYTGQRFELQSYLQRLIGSCLVREIAEEKFWLLRGNGANGKTAFLEIVTAVMGPYATPTTASSLIVRHQEQHTSAVGALYGAGLAYVEELEKDATLDMDKIKRYFGRTPTRVQLAMRGEFVEVTPTAKLIISSNHDPHFPDASKGARRRFVAVPFDQEIPQQRLHFTADILKSEGTGVLRWLVDGALAYVRHGLGTSKIVEDRTAQFHADQDPISDFLEECCLVGPTLSSPFRALWLAYVDHCAQGHEKAVCKRALGVLLTQRGFPEARFGHTGTRGRAGLTLKKELAQQYQLKSMSS